MCLALLVGDSNGIVDISDRRSDSEPSENVYENTMIGKSDDTGKIINEDWLRNTGKTNNYF